MIDQYLKRVYLLKEFESAPDSAIFSQETLCAIRHCSAATIERDRWAGTGVPFIKMGRAVRYRKSDIVHWLQEQPVCHSTSEFSFTKQEDN